MKVIVKVDEIHMEFDVDTDGEIRDLKGKLPLKVFDQINNELESKRTYGQIKHNGHYYFWELSDDSK